MKFSKYFQDNIYKLFVFIVCYGVNILIFLAFKIDRQVIVSLSFIYVICFLLILLIPYFRKKKFYTDLLANIDALDKGYLV